MSIRNKILQALPSAGSGSGRAEIAISAPAGSLVIDVVAADVIGCSIQSLRLDSTRLQGASAEQLKQLGERLAGKLTYLLEPLRPIELDLDGFLLQMRSNPPQKDEDGSQYYEILARREGLRLCRFQKERGQPRREIPAHLTREVLARLGEDFAGVMS